MRFATPDLLWLALLAPAAAAAAWWLWRRRLAADAAWAARALWSRLRGALVPGRLQLSVALLALAVLGIALGLARPRWGTSPTEVERRGVDVVFVLDSSLSMNARDVAPSRLFAAETLVRRLVRAMPENRVALVQAEGTGQVLAPLTLDGAVIDLLLDAIEPGSLPVPGTEIARALIPAAELFGDTGHEHRVIVLLSDGEDHGGGLDDVLARLRRDGVVVHAVGVGTLEGAPVPLPPGAEPASRARRLFGGGDDGPALKRDETGEVVISHLEEEVLARIAEATGGVYLRATGAGTPVEPLVAPIRAMEKRSFESETLNTLQERFQWPLALAVLALAAHLVLPPFSRRRPLAGGTP
ncbi:MAG TPA: VWA domain-containing protein [Thermoanaerobaculia bacterium]|nr:VWA domain-containing protein [Thermoanaerobaculia bacterium]